MMKQKTEFCGFCLVLNRYVAWALLIFGGIVGGLPVLGFASPPPLIERIATYLMALSLVMLAGSYLVVRLTLWRSSHKSVS